MTATWTWKSRNKTNPPTPLWLFYNFQCLTLDFDLPGWKRLAVLCLPNTGRQGEALGNVLAHPPEPWWLPEKQWLNLPKGWATSLTWKEMALEGEGGKGEAQGSCEVCILLWQGLSFCLSVTANKACDLPSWWVSGISPTPGPSVSETPLPTSRVLLPFAHLQAKGGRAPGSQYPEIKLTQSLTQWVLVSEKQKAWRCTGCWRQMNSWELPPISHQDSAQCRKWRGKQGCQGVSERPQGPR